MTVKLKTPAPSRWSALWLGPAGAPVSYLDGALSATVSDRCSGGAGRVLYTHRWAYAGRHTLKLVVVGPKRVDVDGFITI